MRTEKQNIATMRNYGLMQIRCFKAQMKLMSEHLFYRGKYPQLTDEEVKQFQNCGAILEEMEKTWHDNTLRFTGGETA